MRITRLKLRHWMNFKEVDIELPQRAFFIGPNASGKSNLLDAVRFLRDVVSEGGGLQEAVRRRGGISEIRCLAATRNSNVLIAVSLGDDGDQPKWSYELEFNANSSNNDPIVIREEARVSGKRDPIIERPDRHDLADKARLTQTALQQVTANKQFRDIATFLSSVQYLHVVPQIVRDPGAVGAKRDSFGGQLIEQINGTPKKARDARLKLMQLALRIAVPQLKELKLENDKRGVPHLRALYEHWRPQGKWQGEHQFSDGTLRLLGLIWSLQSGDGPLLLEEPEISLNHAIVGKLAPIIARAAGQSERQVLITTHSAELISNAVVLDEVFLLEPGEQGTEVVVASNRRQAAALVEAGIPVGEAVFPETKTKGIDKLAQLDLITS